MKSNNRPNITFETGRRLVVTFVVFAFLSGSLQAQGKGDDDVLPPGSPNWQVEAKTAEKAWTQDKNESERLFNKAFDDSITEHASIVDQMKLRRTLAGLYYHSGAWHEAEDQLAAAIDLCKSEPVTNPGIADQLTHAYQERAWEAHKRYLLKRTGAAGDKDQEMAVSIAEKAFGPDSEETVYKLPTLAVIYSDMGQKEKAHEVMQRALASADEKPSAMAAQWFVYALNARMNASERNYPEAITSFLKARSMAKDQEQRDRIWSEMRSGLLIDDPLVQPISKQSKVLIKKQKYDQLDSMEAELQRTNKRFANGTTELELFFSGLQSDLSSEDDYAQRIFEYKNWLKTNPKSITARLGLADCLVDYAWFARGSGWADSVKSTGWANLETRLEEAKKTLDDDPKIKQECPHAFLVYGRVALGQKWRKAAFMQLVSECHTTWPDYQAIDSSACAFLLPRWYGEENESEKFITSRCDAMPREKGDELYARLVWANSSKGYLQPLFGKDRPLEWARVKAGFAQIFAEYPHSVVARANYIRLALQVPDVDAIKHSFDGYTYKPD